MNHLNSRRDFLKSAVALPCAVALSQVSHAAETVASIRTGPVPKSGIGPRIKFSLNAWSYQALLYKHIKGESGGMSLFDMLEECARLDFDAVDPTGYFFPGYPAVPERRFVNEFKRRAFSLGLAISGTGVRNDFASPEKAKREADVTLTKSWIETAAEMGAPVIRVFAGALPEGQNWDEAAKRVAEQISERMGFRIKVVT